MGGARFSAVMPTTKIDAGGKEGECSHSVLLGGIPPTWVTGLLGFMTLVDGTDTLSQNISKELPLYTA